MSEVRINTLMATACTCPVSWGVWNVYSTGRRLTKLRDVRCNHGCFTQGCTAHCWLSANSYMYFSPCTPVTSRLKTSGVFIKLISPRSTDDCTTATLTAVRQLVKRTQIFLSRTRTCCSRIRIRIRIRTRTWCSRTRTRTRTQKWTLRTRTWINITA
jgi:hypothetical protein